MENIRKSITGAGAGYFKEIDRTTGQPDQDSAQMHFNWQARGGIILFLIRIRYSTRTVNVAEFAFTTDDISFCSIPDRTGPVIFKWQLAKLFLNSLI